MATSPSSTTLRATATTSLATAGTTRDKDSRHRDYIHLQRTYRTPTRHMEKTTRLGLSSGEQRSGMSRFKPMGYLTLTLQMQLTLTDVDRLTKLRAVKHAGRNLLFTRKTGIWTCPCQALAHTPPIWVHMRLAMGRQWRDSKHNKNRNKSMQCGTLKSEYKSSREPGFRMFWKKATSIIGNKLIGLDSNVHDIFSPILFRTDYSTIPSISDFSRQSFHGSSFPPFLSWNFILLSFPLNCYILPHTLQDIKVQCKAKLKKEDKMIRSRLSPSDDPEWTPAFIH